jgi:hypothetical protein
MSRWPSQTLTDEEGAIQVPHKKETSTGEAIAWASDAMVNVRMLRSFSHTLGEDQLNLTAQFQRDNANGKVMEPECFPPEIFVAKDANTNYDKMDHLFFGFGYWVVSSEVADILRQFDMGQGNLYPTKVFRKDRKTPIGDRWFCLNFGNVKKAYVSGGRNPTPHIKKDFVWDAFPSFPKDTILTLTTEAVAGPDFWVDPQIYDTFFVSDRLAKTLKAAGVAKPFGFKRCVAQ